MVAFFKKIDNILLGNVFLSTSVRLLRGKTKKESKPTPLETTNTKK